MRADDLDVKELLSLDPNGGMVQFAGQRALILDASALGILHKELIETLGERVARGILIRFGYVHGRTLAETLKDRIQWDNEAEWRQAGLRLFALQGLFRADPGDAGWSGRGEATWRDSCEAEQHLSLCGKADHPVCWALCGLVSGYLSRAHGRELIALEDRCAGRGEEACHVTVKPREDWGNEADEVLKVFEREGVDRALEQVTSALKSAEHKLRERTQKLVRLDEVEGDMEVVMTRSPDMHSLMEIARSVARVDSSVLITGESGTGKERIARFVHNCSAYADGPFVAVNCGAITDTLLESELFGHARGSFTGAASDRTGLFESAEGGTLFLDEVGEIPPAMQVKLLRAIQEREVRRVGENKSRPIRVRILSATNKDLAAEVAAKRFRQDLYYRLKVMELVVPPLRQRREDILPMARFFLSDGARRMKRKVEGLTPAAADRILGYAWPGNVRELENVMERAVAVTKGKRVDVDDLPPELRNVTPLVTGGGTIRKLKDVERDCILNALETMGGNRVKAAKVLGLGVATLHRKLRSYRNLRPKR
jgi:two-component system, NtrC family, response regulator HydG